MRKNLIITFVVLVVIAIGVLIYATNNKASAPPKSSSGTTSSNQTNEQSVSNSVLQTKDSSTLGNYLTEPNGKPLYTYGQDTKNTSNCSGSCLSSWPAYIDNGSTTDLPSGIGIIKRSDTNQNQYTFNGFPLYTFVGDTSSQPTGNGIADFSLAKP